MDKLLSPLHLGPYVLRNRIVMAPLTRTRAGERNVPREMNVEYYRQRASAGLIITEATPVSPFGHGYRGTPGIHTEEQRDGWRPITKTVHELGGLIFQQLWHVGRLSHQDLQPGNVLPVAPSAIRPSGDALTLEGPKPRPIPRALDAAEIPAVIEEFRRGAQLALESGFDGVEVHGANGYLPDQFLNTSSNQRRDLFRLMPEIEHPHGLSERDFDSIFTKDKPVIFNFHSYASLIHKLAYRRINHGNFHVRGYKEKGNINTPFELAIINQVDRFNLCIDVIDRVARLQVTGAHVKEWLKGQIIESLNYAHAEGIDKEEIRNWTWSQ